MTTMTMTMIFIYTLAAKTPMNAEQSRMNAKLVTND